MSTGNADFGHARRKSDRARDARVGDAEPAESGSPDTIVTHAHSALHGRGDYLDDGTPEGDEESDASEADLTDDPETPNVAAPAAQPGRAANSAIPVRSAAAAGAHYGHRSTPRRRRSDGWADHQAPPPRPRRRRGWIAATFIFMLLFGGAAALDWYLWNTAAQWEQRAEMLTEMNYDLGARLSSEQQTTMQLASEIDLLTQQLATSNQKVSALSSEKANAVDESAYYLQQIESLEDSVSSAGGVANALNRCADGQQELIDYLIEAEKYEPEELDAFSRSVRALCAEAESANARLQESLR